MKSPRVRRTRRAAAFAATLGSLSLLVARPTLPHAWAQAPQTAQTTTAQSKDSGLLSLSPDQTIKGVSYPSLSPDGKTLCFTYLGDLWTAPSAGGAATRLTVHEALDAYPRWSPDGKFIAFTSNRTGNYDVFLVPSQGGSARQVTFDSSNDWLNDWSPDGQKLLFYSQRDTHTFALFTIDLRTRALKQLTKDEEALRFGTFSPDGKQIAYSRAGQPWWRAWYRGSVAAQTTVQDVTTGKIETPLHTASQQFWPSFAPDGKSLFVATIYGSGNTPNLWRVPVGGGTPKALTTYTTDAVRYPSIARNGSLLTYLYNGELYTVKPDGTDSRKVTLYARSDDKINNQERAVLKDGASEVELSPDGKTLALVLRGDIWLVDSKGGDARRLTDDPANDADISWSPDGTRLAFISDRGNQPDLYTIDVKTKALTRLTNDNAEESATSWSPDGKWISFAKAGSQPGLYVAAGDGKTPARKLADGNGNNNFGTGITSAAWSPDSKWVSFSRMDRFETNDVWVVPAVGGAAVNVTRYPGDNVNPRFTKDGKNLLFLSTRNSPAFTPGISAPPTLYRLPLERDDDNPDETKSEDRPGTPPPAPPVPDNPKAAPKPAQPTPAPAKPDRSKDVKIDFDDIHLRAKPVIPGGGGIVVDFMPTPDSQRVILQTGGGFFVVPIAGGIPNPLAPGEVGGNIEFTPDGQRFFYTGANGTPRSLGAGGGPATVIAFTADFLFDRRALYQQAFNEFYRRFGAAFYDAKLHGVDWKATRAKYETQLQGVGTPEEFSNLLSEMVGEVNSSHSEIAPATRPSGPQTATIGVNFDYSYQGPGIKVAEIMPKGPADKPSTRIAPGEYIVAVNGTDVSLTEDYYQQLQDKADKTIELLVNSKPTHDGARTIKIKPIAAQEWGNLEYEAMVSKRRAEVDKLSGGRLAYIHIRGMDQPSLKRFERELYSDGLNKEGLVLDIRGNGGGNTHDAILEALSRHIYGYTQPRDGLRQTQPVRAFVKPVVLLINDNSYSDAEIFPAGFRALKLGKIVGVPTPGYVIGTYGGRLVDGTNYRLPSWGWYTNDNRNMENLGIPPDITVENRPEDIAADRDRQLETAVQTALRDLSGKVDTTVSAEGVGVPVSANTNPNGGSSYVKPATKTGKSDKPDAP